MSPTIENHGVNTTSNVSTTNNTTASSSSTIRPSSEGTKPSPIAAESNPLTEPPTNAAYKMAPSATIGREGAPTHHDSSPIVVKEGAQTHRATSSSEGLAVDVQILRATASSKGPVFVKEGGAQTHRATSSSEGLTVDVQILRATASSKGPVFVKEGAQTHRAAPASESSVPPGRGEGAVGQREASANTPINTGTGDVSITVPDPAAPANGAQTHRSTSSSKEDAQTAPARESSVPPGRGEGAVAQREAPANTPINTGTGDVSITVPDPAAPANGAQTHRSTSSSKEDAQTAPASESSVPPERGEGAVGQREAPANTSSSTFDLQRAPSAGRGDIEIAVSEAGSDDSIASRWMGAGDISIAVPDPANPAASANKWGLYAIDNTTVGVLSGYFASVMTHENWTDVPPANLKEGFGYLLKTANNMLIYNGQFNSQGFFKTDESRVNKAMVFTGASIAETAGDILAKRIGLGKDEAVKLAQIYKGNFGRAALQDVLNTVGLQTPLSTAADLLTAKAGKALIEDKAGLEPGTYKHKFASLAFNLAAGMIVKPTLTASVPGAFNNTFNAQNILGVASAGLNALFPALKEASYPAPDTLSGNQTAITADDLDSMDWQSMYAAPGALLAVGYALAVGSAYAANNEMSIPGLGDYSTEKALDMVHKALAGVFVFAVAASMVLINES